MPLGAAVQICYLVQRGHGLLALPTGCMPASDHTQQPYFLECYPPKLYWVSDSTGWGQISPKPKQQLMYKTSVLADLAALRGEEQWLELMQWSWSLGQGTDKKFLGCWPWLQAVHSAAEQKMVRDSSLGLDDD